MHNFISFVVYPQIAAPVKEAEPRSQFVNDCLLCREIKRYHHSSYFN